MGHLTSAFAGGHDPREEAARGRANAWAAAQAASEEAKAAKLILPPHEAELEEALPSEAQKILATLRAQGHEISVSKAGFGMTMISAAGKSVGIMPDADTNRRVVEKWAASLPTPSPAQPAEETTTPAAPTVEQKLELAPEEEPEIEHTHELVLVGRKGLEVLEPVAGNWEDWSPASVVDHLRKYPNQKVRFHPSRKSFYDPKSRIKTMTAKDAVAFLKNSGRL